jgi:ABC-type iron transport system FetAB permease component
MNSLVWLAVVLVIAWVILKLVLAVTGAALHLLWIAAIIMFALWALGKLRRKTS